MMFLAVLGGITGVFVLIVGGSLWRGFVLTQLWSWFIVPIFHAPHLALVPAIGVALVVGFLAPSSRHKKDKDKTVLEDWVETTVYVALIPALSLGMGWVVHLFMVAA